MCNNHLPLYVRPKYLPLIIRKLQVYDFLLYFSYKQPDVYLKHVAAVSYFYSEVVR